jgi:hypothetical protein
MMAEVKNITVGALSLKEEISHAKLSIKVIYPEHPDVLSPSHVFSLISYGSVQYIIATLYTRFVIWI